MSRKRKQLVVMAPKSEPPAEKSSWPAAIGSLAIAAVVGIGLVTIIGWIEVYTRPPPGWTCWRVERITADGRRMGGHCVVGISSSGKMLARSQFPTVSRSAVISSTID
jgi:hypothetical protein